MSRDQFESAGAFALYRAEHAHRIAEFEKTADAAELIRSDFEQFRAKYLRKFQDVVACFADQGLRIRSEA